MRKTLAGLVRTAAVALVGIALLSSAVPDASAAGNGGKGGTSTSTTTTTKTTSSAPKVGLVCNDTKNFSVQALHPSTFYVDTSSGQDSQWVGYMVTFKTGQPVGASLTTSTGARLVAATGASSLGLMLTKDDVSSYYTTYALLKDLGSTKTDLSHTVVFTDSTGRKDVCTFAFGSVTTAKPNPSSTLSGIDTSNQTLGTTVGVMYVNSDARLLATVRGNTGIVAKGNVISLSPTPATTWPTSIDMTLVKVRWRVDANQFYKDRLWFSAPASKDSPYVVEYTFQTRAVGIAQWALKPGINITDKGVNTHSTSGRVAGFSSIAAPNTSFTAIQGLPFNMMSTLASGTAPFTWSVASGALPPGLALASSGAVSGTPTTAGDSAFALKVVDGASHSGQFPYTIRVAQRGIITNAPPMASVDSDYLFGPIEARGFTGTLKWKLTGALPSGLSWNAATQVISGRVLADAKDSTFSVEVSDGVGASASQQYSIAVSRNKIVVTPPSVDIPDLYLGVDAYGSWFDNDAAERDTYGYNYGYASIFPSDVAGKCSAPTDDTPIAYTAALDPNGDLAASNSSRWALIPVGSVGLELGKTGNFCVQSDVLLRSIPNSGTSQAKDVHLSIEVLSAARQTSASTNGSTKLQKGDLLWNLGALDGDQANATPGQPVCKAVANSTRIDCRIGDMNVASLNNTNGKSMIRLPLTLSPTVDFVQLRLEVTTSSREFDEMPDFDARDLRHPNNVASFVLRNLSVFTPSSTGSNGNGGTNGNAGGNGGSTDGGNSGSNGGNSGSGSTGSSSGSGSGGSTGSGTDSSSFVDPSTSVTNTTPTGGTTSTTQTTIQTTQPSSSTTTASTPPVTAVVAKPVLLPKTMIPLPVNAASKKPVDLTKAVVVNGATGQASTSQPLLMLIPGIPAGTTLYPALATSSTVRNKVLLSQDPTTGGLIVQSDNGWTGNLTVPLLYYSKQAAKVQTTTALGTPLAFSVTVRFNPVSIPKGTYRLVAPGKTLVTWQKSPTRAVDSYEITVDGSTVCRVRTRVTSCIISSALGPKSQIEVTVVGGDSTRSGDTSQKYAATSPVTQSKLTFSAGSQLNSRAISQLDALITLVKSEGFTTVNISGYEDGVASARAVAQSRVAETLAYLRLRLPDARFTGAVSRSVSAAKNRVDIAIS